MRLEYFAFSLSVSVISNNPVKIAHRREYAVPKNFTYTDAGVNRSQRVESKKELSSLQATYPSSYLTPSYASGLGNIFQLSKNNYLDLVIEGGHQVLIARLPKIEP
jgi:hypothetical protein